MLDLINGVEYLYTIPAEEPMSYWILLVVFFLSLLVYGTFVFIGTGDVAETVFLTAVIVGIATLLAFIAIKSHNTDNLKPEQYAVTVSNSVKMSEFTERYNIVEQKGNVYIVEEKENEND